MVRVINNHNYQEQSYRDKPKSCNLFLGQANPNQVNNSLNCPCFLKSSEIRKLPDYFSSGDLVGGIQNFKSALGQKKLEKFKWNIFVSLLFP